jgi:HK97 family phage prohead protease
MVDRSRTGLWEWRTTVEPLELRDGERGDVFAGYAFRYGAISENLGGFVERIAQGAATKTLKETDLRGLFNHDPNNLLGRMGSGTLRVNDASEGLRYFIDKPDTSLGRDLATLVARGDIYGSSFTFKPEGAKGAHWGRSETGFPLREIRQMKMRDVGPVTFPAYSASDVALRSLAEFRSLPFEEIIAAAADERLGELLEDHGESLIEPPSDTHVSVALRRYF